MFVLLLMLLLPALPPVLHAWLALQPTLALLVLSLALLPPAILLLLAPLRTLLALLLLPALIQSRLWKFDPLRHTLCPTARRTACGAADPCDTRLLHQLLEHCCGPLRHTPFSS